VKSDYPQIHAIHIERLEAGLASAVERNMNLLSERRAMVVAHRARRDQLEHAEQVAAESVSKLKSVGYKLDAVRQELTARAEAAETERDSFLHALAETSADLYAANEEIDSLKSALNQLIDPSPCHLDHHGSCQEHNWFGEGECPNAIAVRLVADEVLP
jgi:septal ring factor EnvC (AmiA/AmiB activator)